MKIYFDDWDGYTDEQMLSDWGKQADALEGCEVLFGAYQYEYCEGSALVIFAKGGHLFEVNGGHCSCYGLSEQGYGRAEALLAGNDADFHRPFVAALRAFIGGVYRT